MSSRCKGKKCSRDKICNPDSGRCVLKRGKIGGQLLRKKSPKKKVKSPSGSRSRSSSIKYKSSDKSQLFGLSKKGIITKDKITEIFGKKVTDKLSDYEFFSFLGGGSYGETIKGCKSNGECDAIKIVKVSIRDPEEDIIREYEMGKKFHKYGIGPEMHSVDIVSDGRKSYGITIMEKVDGTLTQFLHNAKNYETIELIVQNLVYLINIMCQNNLTHGDMHSGNIAFVLENKDTSNIYPRLIFIDFGMSCCINKNVKCNAKLEMQQLLRTAYNEGLVMDKKMFVRYVQKLHDTYVGNFGGKNISIKNYEQAMKIADKFSKKHAKTWNRYMDKVVDSDK